MNAAVATPLEYPTLNDVYVSTEDTPENQKVTKVKNAEPQIPVVDRWGQPRWVPTRVCYCLPTEPRPCQLVPRAERAECPSRNLDKHSRTDGVQLYATNPNFGKEPAAEETEGSTEE